MMMLLLPDLPFPFPGRMPKTYLRYVLDRTVGLISSPLSNVAVDATGAYACTGALEDVGVWMLKTGRQVQA